MPPGYMQSGPRPKRKIGPYLSIIDEILTQDRWEPHKQRHTAKRIYDRLEETLLGSKRFRFCCLS